jgi:ABC-type multidrug transport system permease subunit
VTERPLLQLTLVRLRNFYREPSAVFWTFGFPLLLSIALGIAFRSRPPEATPVAVVAGPAAAALKASLSADGELRAHVAPPDQAERELLSGKVALVVAAEAAGAPRYRFDPTRPDSRLARALVDAALERAGGRVDRLAARDERVTEPGSRYIDFLVPGLLGMVLMQGGLWGVGYVLVEMRTRKLLKRLVATPMRRAHFLFAFAIARATFLFLELPLLLGFGWLCFSVTVRGSLLLVTLLSLLGAMTFAGIGLLCASRAQNTQTVGGLINLVSLPMFIGSGVFFSAERFPDTVQPLLRLLPLTALNASLRSVILDGAGLQAVARPAAILALWGAVSFAGALRLFRWR